MCIRDRVYAARRAGSINGETDYVLKRFGVEEPPFVPDVGTQVDVYKRQWSGTGGSGSVPVQPCESGRRDRADGGWLGSGNETGL